MCCAKELQFGPQSLTALFPLVQSISLLSSGAHIFSCISIPEAFFFKMVPALCCSSLHDEGNNFIIYLLDTITNTRDL